MTKAAFDPPKIGIKKKITTIRQRLSEIRHEAEILMHGRLAEMENNTKALMAQVKGRHFPPKLRSQLVLKHIKANLHHRPTETTYREANQ